MDIAQQLELAILEKQKPMNAVIERGDSAVQQFYRGATVFLTGGSGFLGKQLIEKLSRSCDIKKLYMLLRPKKGKTIQQRLTKLLKEPTCSISMLLVSAALAALGMPRTGWLDRVVQYQKEKLFNEIKELAPVNINAEIRPKPEGYEDSDNWDYDSVLRLLTLIRASEKAKPVHKALRRMLQPTRRLMMSIKESKHRFPSIKKDDNAFYYDDEYSYSEEGNLPAPPPVPEDQVVLVVSNPVEARLPSARISVKLLREILEARARAARQMPSTTSKPWKEFIKNMNSSTVASTVTDAGGEEDATTVADAGNDATTVADAGGDATNVADAGGDATTIADAGGDATTVEDAPGDGATAEVETITEVEDTTEVEPTTEV